MGLGWPAKIQCLVNGRAENWSWAHVIDQPEPSPSCHPVYDCPLLSPQGSKTPISVSAALSWSVLVHWVFFNIEHEFLVANSDHGKYSIEPACVIYPMVWVSSKQGMNFIHVRQPATVPGPWSVTPFLCTLWAWGSEESSPAPWQGGQQGLGS